MMKKVLYFDLGGVIFTDLFSTQKTPGFSLGM